MIPALLLSVWMSLSGELQIPSDDDPLKISEEMKQYLETNIDRRVDQYQQLQNLVRIVFLENSLNFTYEPVTRGAIETFNKRSGNCISFTFLFLAMARHLGLDARFREVDIVPIFSRVGNIVSLSGHANAAVFIGGRGYIVDLFPRINPIQVGGRVVSDGRATAHYLSNRGVDQLARGNPQSAMAYFHKALDNDPTAAIVWSNLGVAQSQVQNDKEAEKSYLQSIKLDPGEVVAMSNLAALYERLGRAGAARNYMARVNRFKQRNPYYHFSLGLQAYQSGDYKESIDRFRAAIRLKSTEHHFHLAIARAYAQLGEMDRAADFLRSALKNAPDEASKSRYNEKLALLASRQHRS